MNFNYVLFKMTELVPLRKAIYHGEELIYHSEELIHPRLTTEQWIKGFLKALAITKVSYSWGLFKIKNYNGCIPKTFKKVLTLDPVTYHTIPDCL